MTAKQYRDKNKTTEEELKMTKETIRITATPNRNNSKKTEQETRHDTRMSLR